MQEDSTQHAEQDSRSPQHNGRARDPFCVARADCLGDLAHAAGVDTHTRDALSEIGDRAVQPINPNPAGPSHTAMALVRIIPIARFTTVEQPISAEDFRI